MRAGNLFVFPVAVGEERSAGQEGHGENGCVVLNSQSRPGDETCPEANEHLLTEWRESVCNPANLCCLEILWGEGGQLTISCWCTIHKMMGN